MSRRVEVPSYPVSIFVAGDYAAAVDACRAFCDDVGLCVTVTGTIYVYTGGIETGVVVGLINYGRFPSEPERIFGRAEALALRLIKALGQESATVQAPDKTLWLSFREENRDSRWSPLVETPLGGSMRSTTSAGRSEAEASPND